MLGLAVYVIEAIFSRRTLRGHPEHGPGAGSGAMGASAVTGRDDASVGAHEFEDQDEAAQVLCPINSRGLPLLPFRPHRWQCVPGAVRRLIIYAAVLLQQRLWRGGLLRCRAT